MTDQSLARFGLRAKLMVGTAIIAGITLVGATPAADDAPTFTAEEFSSLPDEQRIEMVEAGYDLPLPPEGYTWAEDLTLVPLSFYAQGDSDERIIRAEDQLIACGNWQAAADLNDAHSWLANDPAGADEHALQLLADVAAHTAEEACA